MTSNPKEMNVSVSKHDSYINKIFTDAILYVFDHSNASTGVIHFESQCIQLFAIHFVR